MRAGSIALVLVSAVGYGQSDWPTYGHDLSGTRYSPLKQIDAKNVNRLVPSWTYHLSAPPVPEKIRGRVGRLTSCDQRTCT
jgi:glucose dehydrogenase